MAAYLFSSCSTARSRLYAKNVGVFITNIAISKLVGDLEYIYYSSCKSISIVNNYQRYTYLELMYQYCFMFYSCTIFFFCFCKSYLQSFDLACKPIICGLKLGIIWKYTGITTDNVSLSASITQHNMNVHVCALRNVKEYHNFMCY